jgi:class 3 adenylate cyclase
VRFADIKGSMDLMENLDPDETRTIVDPALKLMMDAVHHYGGYVAQSTGDSIFALFGAPVAHEDHPQCALYAALRLQDQLKRYSDTLRGQGRLPLQARVGLNTGEVVVRSIATGEDHTEYTPIGHSTSLAARMQALAPVGSIATTEQVRKLCEVTNRQTAGRAARFDSRRAQGSRQAGSCSRSVGCGTALDGWIDCRAGAPGAGEGGNQFCWRRPLFGSEILWSIAAALAYLAWDLAILGFPDQAMKASEQALAWAKGLSRPFALAFTLMYISQFDQFRKM